MLRIELMSARSIAIEGTFVSVRQVIDERVRLIDSRKLTLAYLGSCVSALSGGHRFYGVHMRLLTMCQPNHSRYLMPYVRPATAGVRTSAKEEFCLGKWFDSKARGIS